MLLLLPGAAKRPLTLGEGIDQAIAASKPLAGASIGIQIVRLADGKVLYERDADRLLVPASNTKLFSSALALTRLGADYRFVTSIRAERPVDGEGALNGDLIFVGGGDPSMSGRPYPYQKDWPATEELQAIEGLADQLTAGGLRAVHGDIVGDDSRYPAQPYPDGWSMGDATWEYGAPVSALMVNDNTLGVVIEAGGSEGDPAGVTVTPRFEFLTVENRVRTVAGGEREVHLEGGPGTLELRAWGTIPLGSAPDGSLVAIPDPALFAAAVLRDALVRRGVKVSGRAVARHRALDDAAAGELGLELARRVSPPLKQLLQVVDKVSQNLHAEAMLREVGAVRRGTGTTAAGILELRDFLTTAGIGPDQYRFTDGSGLSRNTLVSARAIIQLLKYMHGKPGQESWAGLLPIGNEDGTLRNRFKGHPEAAAIHAKTGSLGHVRAMSGYAASKRYGELAFSILVNNYAAPDGEATALLDKIGLRLIP